MTVATVSDVATAIGRPVSDAAEVAQVQWWLDSAELQIEKRLGDLALLDQAALKFVEVEAVALRLSNPEGFQSESIDDYTYRFGSETRRVAILDEWWRLLDPETGSGAFSARPHFVPDQSSGFPLDWT